MNNVNDRIAYLIGKGVYLPIGSQVSFSGNIKRDADELVWTLVNDRVTMRIEDTVHLPIQLQLGGTP